MAVLTNEEKIALEEEIKKYQNLPRRERNIKQRELRKKYSDKTIKIKSGKYFSKNSEPLNKQQRRALLKDKNLLVEILKIINKYFPQFKKMLSELTDKRNKSYITYNIKSIIMTRLMALICGITSMNEMNRKFNTEDTINNLSSICNNSLKEVPNWQTIQDVIEELDVEEINEIRKSMINSLIRSKMFDKFRYEKSFQLIVDATGVSSHDYNLNNNCLSKKKDNKIKYFKYVLEAKLCVGNLVLSLDTEWIENTTLNNENEKQDCEIKAFKRMAPRIKKNYPRLSFIVTGDALYATTPMINICNKYGWHYIFNLKKDRLKNIWEDFEDNINYENEVQKDNYYLSSNIEFKGNYINALRYTDKNNNKTFNYITDLKVNNSNIEDIVALGRARWKIENCAFYVQKHNTFCISHLCSRNDNGIKIHYLFIQIAHIIRQLLEFGSLVLRSMRLDTKKEVSENITNSLTSKSNQNLNNIETNFQLRFDD